MPTPRQCECLILILLLWHGTVALAAASDSAKRALKKQALKEQVMQIPREALVKVQLRNKEKLQSRLIEVCDEGLILQVEQAGKIEEREIAFDDLKSIKIAKKHPARRAFRSIGGALGSIGKAGGVALLIGLMVWAEAYE